MLILWTLWACGGDVTPAAGDLLERGAPGAPRPKLEVGSVGGASAEPEVAGELLSSADCDTIVSEALPAEGCLTGVIGCGETVLGHTQGGVNRFDTRFYEQFFCTPATTDHDDGGERVYELRMPDGDWHADIWLETPCADLDLAAMKVEIDEGCPDKRSRIDICEMNRQDKTRREHVRLVSQRASRWLVVVEGRGTAEGAFGLKVECNPGL